MKLKYLGCVFAFALAFSVGGIKTEAKLIYDVTEMGAVADDDISDAVAIQNSIKLAVANGGEVYIPSGEYIVDRMLTVSGPTTIEMENDTIISVTGNSKHFIKADYIDNKCDFTIRGGLIEAENSKEDYTAIYVRNSRNLLIKGTTLNVKNSRGILVKDCDDVKLENIDVIAAYENSINVQRSNVVIEDTCIRNVSHKTTSGNGMYIRECKDVVVDNLDISDVSYNGILCNTAKSLTIKNSKIARTENCGFTIVNTDKILIENNEIDDHSSDGIWIENKPSTVCKIKSNEVRNSMSGLELSSGIVVFYGKDVDIIDNYVENVFNNAIYIKECDDIEVRGNEVERCAQSGIVMLNVKGIISNNRIDFVNKAAISLHGMKDSVIEKNIIKESNSIGINVSECTDLFVEENNIQKCGYAGIKIKNSSNIALLCNYLNNMRYTGVRAENTEEVDIRNNDIWNVSLIPILEKNCSDGAILDNIIKLSTDNYFLSLDKMKYGKNIFFHDTYSDFKLKKVVRKKKYAKLVWNPIPDVDGYKIYRTIYGKNNWECIGEEIGLSDTYYDYGVKKGKRYQYKIKGYIDGNLVRMYTRFTNTK